MIYTAIFGQKDTPRTDIKCFTGDGGVMEAKEYKILSHKFIDSEISVWLDGNIELLVPEELLIEHFLGDADIGLWKHPYRDCLYEEAEKTKDIPKVEEQAKYYKSQGFPKNAGLYECGTLVRRNTPRVNEFNEMWWEEIKKWSVRDQISFPYVLSKFPDLKIKVNEGNVREHPWFRYNTHN